MRVITCVSGSSYYIISNGWKSNSW
jgi:hypothetical protein